MSALAFDPPLPDADLELRPDFLAPPAADLLFEELRHQLAWRQDQIRIFGRVHDLPRLQAWYGDPGARYIYSGIQLEPEPWIPALVPLRERLERELAPARFNSVLANLYRDGRDSNGWHSDDEPALGERPLIASLSLGATRRFQLRHKSRSDLATRSLELRHGTLLVMRGATQDCWRHAVPKTRRVVGERINLTWRLVTDPRCPRNSG